MTDTQLLQTLENFHPFLAPPNLNIKIQIPLYGNGMLSKPRYSAHSNSSTSSPTPMAQSHSTRISRGTIYLLLKAMTICLLVQITCEAPWTITGKMDRVLVSYQVLVNRKLPTLRIFRPWEEMELVKAMVIGAFSALLSVRIHPFNLKTTLPNNDPMSQAAQQPKQIVHVHLQL